MKCRGVCLCMYIKNTTIFSLVWSWMVYRHYNIENLYLLFFSIMQGPAFLFHFKMFTFKCLNSLLLNTVWSIAMWQERICKAFGSNFPNTAFTDLLYSWKECFFQRNSLFIFEFMLLASSFLKNLVGFFSLPC